MLFTTSKVKPLLTVATLCLLLPAIAVYCQKAIGEKATNTEAPQNQPQSNSQPALQNGSCRRAATNTAAAIMIVGDGQITAPPGVAIGMMEDPAVTVARNARTAIGSERYDEAVKLNGEAYGYQNSGNYEAALPLFKKALAIWDSCPVKNPQELKKSLDGLGYAYNNRKDYAAAEDYFKRAIAVEEKQALEYHDPNDESLAMALDNLARAYIKEEKFAQAEPLVRRSLAMREHTYGHNSDMVICCLELLSDVEHGLGKQDEIQAIGKEMLAIRVAKCEPALGAFYAEEEQRISRTDCILPLPNKLGPGARFDEMTFTRELKKRLGEEADNDAAVCSVGGWTRCGGSSQPEMSYDLYFNHKPVVSGDGRTTKRQTVISFRVKPISKAIEDDEVLLPAATVISVYQRDEVLVYRKLQNDKPAQYNASRIYGWDGKLLACAPGEEIRKSSSSVQWAQDTPGKGD